MFSKFVGELLMVWPRMNTTISVEQFLLSMAVCWSIKVRTKIPIFNETSAQSFGSFTGFWWLAFFWCSRVFDPEQLLLLFCWPFASRCQAIIGDLIVIGIDWIWTISSSSHPTFALHLENNEEKWMCKWNRKLHFKGDRRWLYTTRIVILHDAISRFPLS